MRQSITISCIVNLWIKAAICGFFLPLRKEGAMMKGLTIKYKSLSIEVSALALATLVGVIARALGLF